jgi:hypothetical protein
LFRIEDSLAVMRVNSLELIHARLSAGLRRQSKHRVHGNRSSMKAREYASRVLK